MNIRLFLLFFSTIWVSSATQSLFGQNKIKWVTWEEAIEKSKKDKKKLFVDIYTDWCGWCKKMDQTTFGDDDIAKYINKNYHAIKFDAEMTSTVILKGDLYSYVKSGQRGYHELAAKLLQGRMSFPSTVILDEDLNLIQAIPGYQSIETMEQIITYFGSNSHKTIPWARFTQTYDSETYLNLASKQK